ncbi:paired amphipathic helix protein [Medicago truncatula]|uniref:Paired amphipathic helix protein n=1 Tax=Medicago truncatula TaxID=3880 RepID=G7IEP1_MEDTR|nr:paired amphipathic helix protein [Medicago truncatula]
MTNAFFGTPNNVKTKDELTQLLTCRLFFWEEVKVAFEYNRIKCDQFSKLLKLLQAGRDTHPKKFNFIKAIVKGLLKGHANLILGFNAFLPKEHQITLHTTDRRNGKAIINSHTQVEVARTSGFLFVE